MLSDIRDSQGPLKHPDFFDRSFRKFFLLNVVPGRVDAIRKKKLNPGFSFFVKQLTLFIYRSKTTCKCSNLASFAPLYHCDSQVMPVAYDGSHPFFFFEGEGGNLWTSSITAWQSMLRLKVSDYYLCTMDHANSEQDFKKSLIIPLSRRFCITLDSLAALSELAWWFCSLAEIFADGGRLFRPSVMSFMEQSSCCSSTVSSSDSSESNLMWLVELPESRRQNKVKVSRQSHYDLGGFAWDFRNTVTLSEVKPVTYLSVLSSCFCSLGQLEVMLFPLDRMLQ